jgi:hypothetical protein
MEESEKAKERAAICATDGGTRHARAVERRRGPGTNFPHRGHQISGQSPFAAHRNDSRLCCEHLDQYGYD